MEVEVETPWTPSRSVPPEALSTEQTNQVIAKLPWVAEAWYGKSARMELLKGLIAFHQVVRRELDVDTVVELYRESPLREWAESHDSVDQTGHAPAARNGRASLRHDQGPGWEQPTS